MKRLFLAGALSLAWLFAFAAQAQRTTALEAEGNLARNMPIGCVALDAVPSGSNPVDLYAGALQCVRDGDFVRARELMLIGDIRGRFDQGRVSDVTAHSAPIVAKRSVQAQFKPKQRAQLESAFRALSDTAARCTLGERITAKGAPDYVPTYMIRHGMSAFTGGAPGGLKEYEDPSSAYQAVVTDYLKCPPAGPGSTASGRE